MDLSGLTNNLSTQYSQVYATASDSKLTQTLKNTSKDTSDEELLDACKQFEQYFVEQVFKEMEKTLPEGGIMGDNEYASMFGDTYVQTLAESVTDSGQLGLAQQLYESMSKQSKAVNLSEDTI